MGETVFGNIDLDEIEGVNLSIADYALMNDPESMLRTMYKTMVDTNVQMFLADLSMLADATPEKVEEYAREYGEAMSDIYRSAISEAVEIATKKLRERKCEHLHVVGEE